MSFKSLLGWLILIACLAVPAVLFWNWWANIQTSARAEGGGKSAPSSAPFGGVAMMQGHGTPEIEASTAAVRTGSAVVSSKPSVSIEPAEPGASSGTLKAPRSEASVQTAMAGKEGIEYAPKTDRDPTLSLIDIKMLLREEEEKREAREGVQKALQEPPRPKAPPIEDKIELQGIVASRNGIMALVNGERLREGDRILGVVVKHITTRFVVFKYRGRTFRKRVE